MPTPTFDHSYYYPAAAAGGVLVVALALLHAAGLIKAHFQSTRKRHMSITVKWGRDSLRVPLAPEGKPELKLADLRQTLAELTSLPLGSFKLIHAGGVMKDDNAPLSAYGIRPGSKVQLIGGGDAAPGPAAGHGGSASARKNKPAVPATEETTIAAIRAELAQVEATIVPALDAFIVNIAPAGDFATSTATATSTAPAPSPGTIPAAPSSNGNIAPAPLANLEMEHKRLGELLLQALLRLDVLATDGSWVDARKERKAAVKAVQELLDRLDGGWKERGERLKARA